MPERFNAKDALADYVTVPQRIAQFYELFGTGRLVTGEVRVEMGPDGKPRVIVQAFAYRTPEDPLPGVGWSWMELPGTTAFTRGSELENTETSAWGRAIASLGILVDRSVASANEVANKQTDRPGNVEVGSAPPREGSLTGTIEKAKPPHDLNLRETPDGPAIGFGLKEGRQIVRVIATGELASQIGAFLEAVEGKKATVYGHMADASWTVKKGTPDERTIGYIALTASRLVADRLELPMPEGWEPIHTTEAGEADPAVPTSPPEPETPSGGALCLDKGSLDTICNREKGHPGKHQERATDGRVLASW